MIIISGEYGQLGNRLIVFANMLAAARQHGLHVINPAFHEYARYFEGTRRAIWPSPVHGGLKWVCRYAGKFRNRTGRWPPGLRVLDIGWHDVCDLDGAEFLALARRRGVLLAKGWQFRARRTLPQHAQALRDFFAPVATHRIAIARLLEQVRCTADVVVGVHVRHGDYRQFLGGRFFYATSAYAALLRRLTERFAGRRVAYLVCSNAPQPAAAFDGLDVTFGSGHSVEDLYALAGCDYLVGPPSTYTMWASFYGQVPLHILVDPDTTPALTEFGVIHDFNQVSAEYSAAPVVV